MNLLGKLQSQYEQIWKSIIRPPRTSYSQQTLGPNRFALEGVQVKREDFQVSNARDYAFSCSLWSPAELESYSCIIYLHTSNGNRTEGMEYLGKLIKNNIALCTFDFSGCGNAEGEYVTLGYYEQEDLRLVLQYLKNDAKIKDVAIWGRQMGAVTAMMYLGKTIEVKAAIFDSPFRSLKSYIEYVAGKNYKIPMFVLAGALKIIASTIESKANFSIYNINPLKYSVPGLICPAFFIVSTDDEVIPAQHTLKLFSAYAGSNKQLKQLHGKHSDPRSQECVNEVIDFLLRQFVQNKEIDREKVKKQFDFFQAKARVLRQKERQEQQTKPEQNVDFFAQSQSPQENNKQAEENSKKGDFTFSGLFSFFSKDKEPKKKENEKEVRKPLKDGYEQTRLILASKFQQQITKLNSEKKQLKIEKEQKITKDVSNPSGFNENQIKEWVYCYI